MRKPAPPVVIAPAIEKPLVVAALPATIPERLPHTFEPKRYAARLQVDPAQPVFTGTIEITGELAEPAPLIWINAEGLTIHRVTASHAGVDVRMSATYTTKTGWLALRSEQPLATGSWTLTIAYAGTWSEGHAVGGFVERDMRAPPSHATDAASYVYTQFEPDFARRVFPCFDEPDRKVPWQLTLDVPEALVAASNTPIESEMHAAALHWTSTTNSPLVVTTIRFAPTPPLPSYLIAFAVGPFDVVDAGHSKSGIPIRLLTLHGKGQDVAAVAITIPALLDKIESWLGVPFPYPKLDLVEVQVTDRWWLAMENAGLITFNSDVFDHKLWDSTIVHEIAHHWFGDYVTPAWWDDVWLNESFAYWIANHLTDQHFPDPAPADPPIVVPVDNPRPSLGSNQAFASRSFMAIHKGQQFLGLLHAVIGDEPFRRMLASYLTAHAHGTVHTSDLRDAIGGELAQVFDRYASSPTSPLAFELRCDATSRRIEVKGFDTTGLVCVAYDRDGTRSERCGQLAWGSAAVELPAKRCPRWVLPRAVHPIVWTAPQLEAVRDFGWSALTETERLAVMGEVLGRDPTRGRLKLSFIEKSAGIDEDTLRSWATGYLLSIDRFVPPALRAAYDAWITKLYAARARAFGIAPTNVDDQKRQEMQSMLFLVMSASDRGLRTDALALLPKLDELDGPARVLVLRAAIADKLSYAEDLAAELPRANHQRMSDIASALETVPDLLDFMTKHVAELRSLPQPDKQRLYNQLCDETRRADVEALGKALLPKWDQFSLRDYEWCITERKALEPELRAFLSPAPVAAKPSHGRR